MKRVLSRACKAYVVQRMEGSEWRGAGHRERERKSRVIEISRRWEREGEGERDGGRRTEAR